MTLYNKTKQRVADKAFPGVVVVPARDAKVQHKRNLWLAENEEDKTDKNVFAIGQNATVDSCGIGTVSGRCLLTIAWGDILTL